LGVKLDRYDKEVIFQTKRIVEELIPKLKKEFQDNINYCRSKMPRLWVIQNFYEYLLKEVEQLEIIYKQHLELKKSFIDP